MTRFTPIAAAAAVLAATPAFAHLPHGEYGSFAAGLSHPLFGLDHIIAMVAVGLWASVLGGRALWLVPAGFVGTMIAGYLLALLGLPLPLVEPMILSSIVLLGLLVALTVRLNPGVGMALAGLFALFHGHAHGGELAGAGALPFGAGFAVATAALHAAGMGLGLLVGRSARFGTAAARAIGGLTAAAGLVLAFG